MSTAKEKYIAFTKENYVPLFFRDLYLDAVCDGEWDVILFEEQGKITAAYIYMLKQKFGVKYIVQPQLCPYTGPYYFDSSDTRKAYSYLIDSLPKHQLLIQDYFHSIPIIDDFDNTRAEKHTNIIDMSDNIDTLWQQQSSKHRKIITKAEKNLKHEKVEDIDVFLDFVSITFKDRGKTFINDPQIFRKLDEALSREGLRKIVKCTDNNNVVVAMCYFMKDEYWTFNFANSVIDDYKHGGMNLILWNGIKSTLLEGRSFDFEGSMIPGIDKFFSRYKGTKTPYQSRYKSSNKLVDILVKIKNLNSNK